MCSFITDDQLTGEDALTILLHCVYKRDALSVVFETYSAFSKLLETKLILSENFKKGMRDSKQSNISNALSKAQPEEIMMKHPYCTSNNYGHCQHHHNPDGTLKHGTDSVESLAVKELSKKNQASSSKALKFYFAFALFWKTPYTVLFMTF